jgi:ribosomal-protein-serine acetyltransferase
VLRAELGDGAFLRLLTPRDAEELYDVVVANREHLAPWMPWVAGYTLSGARDFIATALRQIADDDGMQTVIVDGGGIAGCVGVHRINWGNRSTSVGYWLAADRQGRGLMTRAVRAYVEQAFGPWDLQRISIEAAPENTRSRAVAERLGFREEGVLRQAERVGDRMLDHVVYGLLAEEWRAAQASP